MGQLFSEQETKRIYGGLIAVLTENSEVENCRSCVLGVISLGKLDRCVGFPCGDLLR